MRVEDWIIIGLLSGVALIYLITRIVVFWAKHQLMKTQLESAVSNVRLGYTVTRRFTKIIANAEMTGKTQTFTITKEFSDTMYKVEEQLKETLKLLEPDSLT